MLPSLGAHAGRDHGAHAAAGGDVTFAIDADAEAFLEAWFAEHGHGMALFSEDRGLVPPPHGEAEWVLVVDPIDGTRPALAGLEAACVSVALAPHAGGTPRMGDVEIGCVIEIKSGARFLAQRGQGVESTMPTRPSQATDLDRLFWTYGLRGRPARATMEVLGDLVDRSSVGGGCFELGSACFDMTRVLTGQLDAYLEPGPRLVEEVPGMRAAFEAIGGGAVLNNSPYDVAAAALCLTEGGVTLSDARGASLDDRPILGSGAAFQMSLVASGNPELHGLLLAEVQRGVDRLHAAVGS